MLLALLLMAAASAPGQGRLPALQARVEQALPNGPLRRQFRETAMGWRRALTACGGQAACKTRIADRRSAYLSALVARTSADNPTLTDLQAAALVGRWRAGKAMHLDAARGGHIVEDGTPPPDSLVEARPGALCTPDCHDAGLEPGTLGDSTVDTTIRAALKLPAGAPAWTVILDGKAGYRLLQAGDTLFVAATSCDEGARTCWPTLIPMAPLEQARLVGLTP